MKQKKVKNQVNIKLSNGDIGKIESIDITDLGYINVKAFIPSKNIWISTIMKDGLDNLIRGCNFELIEDPQINKI